MQRLAFLFCLSGCQLVTGQELQIKFNVKSRGQLRKQTEPLAMVTTVWKFAPIKFRIVSLWE